MLESLLVTNIAIIGTWGLILIGLTGLGLLILQLYGLTHFNSLVLISAFWIGFSAFLCIGQIWNLFLPANGYLWLLIFCLAFVGFAFFKKQFFVWVVLFIHQWKTLSIFLIIFFIITNLLAYKASNFTPVHDTGSYHLPVTLWFHDFPIVPGLSNLHSRMGFNSSLFTFSASLSEWVWTKRPHHVMMGPLILMTYLISFYGIKRIILSGDKINMADVFAASLIMPTYFIYHWMNYAVSLSPNSVVFIMLLVASWLVIKDFYQENETIQKSNYLLFSSAVLFAGLISVKITIVVFALLMWGLIIYWIRRSNRNILKKHSLKTIYWIVLFTTLLIGTWMVRSIVLSGYPFYPITIGGMDVDWKVPEIQAKLDADWSRSYSRGSYDQPPESFIWMESWFRNLFNFNKLLNGASLPIIISLVSGFIMFLVLLIRGRRSLIFVDKRIELIFISLIIGLFTWFFTAPDIRFGIGYFWLLACLLTSIVLCLILKNQLRIVKIIVTILIPVVLIIFLFVGGNKVIHKAKNSQYLIWSYKQNVGFNELLDQGLSPLPLVEMRKYTSLSGLVLNVPIVGNQIWDAPLLSTPHPSAGLRLRNPKQIADGFKSVGLWRPYGYPILKYPWHKYVKKRLDNYYRNN